MGDVALWLYSPSGRLRLPNVPVAWVDWALEENTFGKLTASGPMSEIDPAWFVTDALWCVMRSIDGGTAYLEGETAFLLRYWDFGADDSGAETWSIEAYTPEYILTGRIVDSWASTEGNTNPATTKSGAADDVIKELVTENAVTAATAARNLANLTVDPNASDGEDTDKGCAWANVFDTILELCEDSSNLGTYLSFGLALNPDSNVLTFHTWAGARGADHTRTSGDPVTVSREFGNLKRPRIAIDHRSEVTAVRAGGKGEGQTRATARVEDTTRSSASPYAYREEFFNASNQAETTDTLTAAARSALERGRPTKTFSGEMVDTEYARYGERVRFGDLVTAEFLGESFNCRLSRVRGYWNGAESLTIELAGMEVL